MNHFISLPVAVDMTTRYRSHQENILANAYQGKAILPRCETFDKGVFETLAAKTGCKEIRIYYGMDEELKIHAILVAVDEEGRDILPDPPNAAEPDDDDIAERGIRCPDLCPPASPLNP